MKKTSANKLYSMKEAAKEIKVTTGTIRRWEKELNGLLMIQRTSQGARIYRENDIELLKKIKEMREKNLSTDMIRQLVSKHLENQQNKEEQKSTEIVVHKTIPQTNETMKKDMLTELERFKDELSNEIKYYTSEIVNELKDELASTSLHTIRELSKSIQRSNEKRKVEVQKLEETLEQISEDHYEAYTSLTKHVTNSTENTYEQLSKKINDISKMTTKENKLLLSKMTKKYSETKNEIANLNDSLMETKEQLLEELERQAEEIQRREEAFNQMITSFRQAAATTERKKRWWRRLTKLNWL